MLGSPKAWQGLEKEDDEKEDDEDEDDEDDEDGSCSSQEEIRIGTLQGLPSLSYTALGHTAHHTETPTQPTQCWVVQGLSNREM